MNAESLHKLLSNHRFTLSHEKALQAEISALLTDNKIEHSREVKLSDRDCIDFLVGDTGMEVKLKGSAMAIYKQFIKGEWSKMMQEWVWNNYKQMLNKVLESKDSNIIAENSMLVIPKLIDEIDSLRSRMDGTAGACARERETVCVV